MCQPQKLNIVPSNNESTPLLAAALSVDNLYVIDKASRVNLSPENKDNFLSAAAYSYQRSYSSHLHDETREQNNFELQRKRTLNSSLVRRNESVPVLTEHEFHSLEVSEIMYSKIYPSHGGTMVSSAFNLACATLGAGVLALPYAVVHLGLIGSCLLLLLIFLCNIYSIYLLIRVGNLLEIYTYEKIAYEVGGPWCERLVTFFMVAFCWGCAVTYIVVVGDFITPLTEELQLSRYISRHTATLCFWLCIMFPLSLARRINTLRYASFVGAISTLMLAIALVMKTLYDGAVTPTVALFVWDNDTLGGLSTIMFSYCFQPVLFQVYSEMKHASLSRICECGTMSMGACTMLYYITGLFGALGYGVHVRTNILSTLSNELALPYVMLAYFGMAIAVTMAFPLTIFPTRDSVVLFLGYSAVNKPIAGWQSSLISAILATLALFVGLLVPNIRSIFDILGGVFGGALSLLFPAFFALRLKEWNVRVVGIHNVLGAVVIFIFGCVSCILGLYNSLRSTLLERNA